MEMVERDLKSYFLKNQIVAALIIVVIGWFLIQIREILVLFFISYILMAALAPYVRILQRHRLPRPIAAGIVYTITLLLIVLLIGPIIPFFVSQMQSLCANVPKFIDNVAHIFGFSFQPSYFQNYATSQLGNIGLGALAVTTTAFSIIFALVFVFVLSFYLTIDQARVRRELVDFVSDKYKKKTEKTMDLAEDKLGAWFRGQLTLGVFIGFITWIVLTIIGLPFALPLALLAGILEIIPTLGPILSSIPAILVAVTISPLTAVIVVIAYIVIQMLENNLLVPKVMQKAVGLNPIVIILGITVGANLLGVLGALLSIPFIAMVMIIFRTLTEKTPTS